MREIMKNKQTGVNDGLALKRDVVQYVDGHLDARGSVHIASEEAPMLWR